MKILYVASYSPWPLHSGSSVRSSHIIEALSRNHDVTVAMANAREADIGNLMSEEGDRWTRLAADRRRRSPINAACGIFSRSRPTMKPRDRNAFRAVFLRWVDEVRPDLVWHFQASSLWRTGFAPGIPAVYDMDDLESVKRARLLRHEPAWRRVVSLFDSLAFARAEKSLLRAAKVVLVSNPGDKPAVERLTKAVVTAVPNGFTFSDSVPTTRRDTNRILFYGLLRYKPNAEGIAWFCRDIWPLILSARPDSRLDVVGSHLGRMQEVANTTGVTVHGEVDDLDSFIAQSAMLVVPLRIGGGTRIKILEAWAKKLPVVSTSIGCEGLGATDGENLLVADSPKAFAGQCVELLQDPELGARLAGNAYSYARERYDWPVIYEAVDHAVELACQ